MRGALAVAALLAAPCTAYNNGYGRKPLLGWQTWCSVGPCGTDHCFDQQIRDMAKTLVDTGMKDMGYEWVVLDDCWHPTRNSNGTLVPYPGFFPNGMVPVIDYVHSLGLKFGLYTSIGTTTCHGGWSPGSYGHFTEDADLFASWGVDYVKVDWCGQKTYPENHKVLSEAMNKTGRPMVLELCRGTYQHEDKWGYAPEVAQIWRSNGDHHDNWNSLNQQLDHIRNRGNWSGPYGWAYMDMMMTGGQGCNDQFDNKTQEWDWTTARHCPGSTDNEYRTEFAMFAVASSPMMIGTDIRNMTPIMSELILNPEVLEINQDYTAPVGDASKACDSSTMARNEVWVRRLSDGTFAVALTNWGDAKAAVSFCFDTIGWTGSSAKIRDVFARKDLGTFSDHFNATVDTHDTMLLRLAA